MYAPSVKKEETSEREEEEKNMSDLKKRIPNLLTK